MKKRPQKEKNLRKLTKVGGKSYAITIPVEMVRELGWKERQKLIIERYPRGIKIRDWKE